MSERTTARDQRLALGLCIVITLLLIGGMIGSWVFRSLRQQRAVEQLKGTGKRTLIIGIDGLDGESEWVAEGVDYDYQLGEDLTPVSGRNTRPAWLRELLGIDFVATVRGAGLGGTSKDHLDAIRTFTGLRSLALSGHAPEAAASLLPNLPELERLVFFGEHADDETLDLLSQLPRLRILRVTGAGITDRGVEQIARITTLRELMIFGADDVSSAGLEQLGRLESLERLSIGFCGAATDRVLEQLQTLKELRQLVLYYHHEKSAGGLKFLGGLPKLTRIGIGGDKLTDEALAALPDLPKLETLVLDNCPLLHAAGLANLAKLPNLQSLEISKVARFDDACLEQIKGLPKLTRLTIHLDDAELTDAGLAHLAELSHLNLLDLTLRGSTTVSPGAIKDLRKRLPDCNIR